MKKHTKALTGLAASVLALGAAGFGFSRWSSDLTLNGKVTAAGNWDVRISDASVISHSKSSAVIPAAEATVYPVYARAFNASEYPDADCTVPAAAFRLFSKHLPSRDRKIHHS